MIFLVKALVISVVLFAFKSFISKMYAYILGDTASVSLPTFQPGVTIELSRGNFFNVEVGLIPFISLILATPKIELNRRIKGIFAGAIVFLFIDLVVI